MNFENTLGIAELLQKKFKINLEVIAPDSLQPQILVDSGNIYEIATYLFNDPEQLFDLLNCITAVDNHPGAETIDLLYHLTSFPFQKSVILKTVISRDISISDSIISLSSIWKTAEWHEREIFDLFGIRFSNHADLRRILLPADWQGHPLRKDYQEQDEYHGIKVKY